MRSFLLPALGSLLILGLLPGCGVNEQPILERFGDVYEASAAGDIDAVLFWERDGFDLNTPNEAGKTPLHLAAENGHVELVDWLLRVANVDVLAEDAEGRNALECAQEAGQVEVIAFFERMRDQVQAAST